MVSSDTQHRRPRGRWRKRLLFLVLFVGVGFGGLSALARTETVLSWVRATITDVVRSELGLVARIGDAELDVKTLSLVAHDIALDHPQHGPLARARALRVRPWLIGLTRGVVKLKSIALEGARVTLVVRDGELINVPQLKSSGGDTREIDLPFRTLTLEDASVAVDAKPHASGELHGIDATIDGSARNLIGIELAIAGGHVDHRKGRETLDSVKLSGHVKPLSVWINQFSVTSEFLTLAAHDTAMELPLGRHYQANVNVRADLGHLSALPLDIELPEITGEVKFHGEVRDDKKRPVGKGHLSLNNVEVIGYGFGETVEVDLSTSEDEVSFTAVANVIRKGGAVELAGKLGLGEGLPLDVQAKVRDVSLAKLVEQLDVTPNAIVDWTLAGTWHLKGTLDPLDLSGPLRMPTRDFRITRDAWHVRPQRHVLAVESARVTGNVAIRPDGLHLEHLQGELPHSRIAADVLIGFTNLLRVRASSEHVDLQDCTPLLDFPLAGVGSFKTEVNGGYDDPQVHGHVQFDGFAFNTFPFGDVKTDYRLEKEGLAARFPLVTAKKRDSAYAAQQMVLDFSDDRVLITADFDAQRLTLADFYHVFHFEEDQRFLPFQGAVKGVASLRFTLGFPGDTEAGTMDSDFDLEVLPSDLNGFAFQSGHLDGHWKWLDWRRSAEGGELRLDHLSLRKGKGTVNVSGYMHQNGVLDMVMVADRIEMSDTEGMRDRIPDLRGTYAATGTIKGTLDVTRADLDLMFTNVTYQGRALGDGRGYVRLTDREDPWIAVANTWSKDALPDEPCAHARYGFAKGTWPSDPHVKTVAGLRPALLRPMAFVTCIEAFNGQFAMDMAYGRTKVFPVRGRLELHDMVLDELLPQGRNHEEALTGVISGTMDFTGGAMLEPLTLAGHLSVPSMSVARGSVYLRSAGPIEANFGDGAFRIERAEFEGPGSNLRVGGGGSLSEGLALQMNGGVDLGLLSSLSNTVSGARGQLNLRARVSGRLDRPSIFGQASVRDAALRFASFPMPIEGVAGDITFSAQRVILDRFTANVSGGTLTATGHAALSGRHLGSYALNIQGRNLSLPAMDGAQATLSARTELAWEEGQRLPVLSGTLNVEHLRYTRPILVGSGLSDINRSERANVEQYNPEADHVALDIRVTQAAPFKVENNLLEADVMIVDSEQPFRIVGTDQRFGVLGSMSLRRGSVRFRDVAFDIRSGEISFDDPTRIFPRFDLAAATDIRRAGSLQQNWHILLRATGTSESFSVRTRSDPYLSEEDIALLLAIGMTNAELNQLQAGGLTGESALNALATVSGVDEQVRRAIPAIDDFRVSNGYSARSFRNVPQLHVGKRIAEGVRLSATTALADSRDLSTSVQWQLSEEASVEASYNNQNASGVSQIGDVGADLRWRLEFE